MIKLTEKIGYGFGDMASSMFWKLFGAYLMIFYTDVFGLPAAVGTMFLITRIWDSVFDPIVGVAADRTQTRWGKFRPYLLWLAIPFAAIGVLTFMTPSFGQTGNLIYAYITYSLMMMVYSAINVPYASLLGVMSPLPQDRNTLSTYRMVFAYIGSFIALLLFMPMVRFFSGNSDELADQQHGWTMAVVVIAILCAILFYGCFAWTKERVKPIKEQQGSLKDDLRDLLHNKPWWILLGAGVSALVFNSIRDGATVYYFKYFIIEEAYAGDIIGVFDPGIFSIGDTLCMPKEQFAYEGIPTFAPEHFARVRQVDTMKRKQFVKGITQIAQEGAIQIFQEFNTGMEEIIVGVVGVLQFDVLKFRLESEYNVEIRLEPLPYEHIRWIANKEEVDLTKLVGTSDMKKIKDMKGNPLLLFVNSWSVGMVLDRNKGLELSEFGKN